MYTFTLCRLPAVWLFEGLGVEGDSSGGGGGTCILSRVKRPGVALKKVEGAIHAVMY